jgi:outer membrane protein
VITTVAQAQDAYWDLVAAQEQVKAAQQAEDAAKALLKDNQEREQFGTLAPVDVTSAASQVASTHRDLVVAQTNLQVRETGLKIFFSRDVNDLMASSEVVPQDALPVPKEGDIPPLNEALRTAMEKRPELGQQEGTVSNDELAIKFTRNFMKPTFNVFGLLATGGLSGNRLLKSGVVVPGGVAEELNQLFAFDYPEYAFGFAISIPIKNRSAQADNIRAQLDEHQAEVSLQNIRNQIQVEVRTAVVGLQQAKSQVEAAERALQFSRESADATQTKFEAGVATPYDVTLAQRDLLNAEFADVQARVSYAKAQVELDRAMGITLDKHHISTDEAIAGKVAAGQP